MGVDRRHGDTYLYHVMMTKTSTPRVTGYMPTSGLMQIVFGYTRNVTKAEQVLDIIQCTQMLLLSFSFSFLLPEIIGWTARLV